MGKPRHASIVTIRLAGRHETWIDQVRDRIQLMIPSLVVTIADRTAARALAKTWQEAQRQAAIVFNGDRAPAYKFPGWKHGTFRIYSTVVLGGRLGGIQVYGRTPRHSPSGCGELKVQVGRLVVICDDRAAFDDQYAAWTAAADLADQVWPRKLLR